MSQIIAMWSGPRNLSTAMMRSFGNRADTSVIDEPFFAPFLSVSGKDHPGRAETLARHETDPLATADMITTPSGTAYSFQKHMPHHMLEGFPMAWAAQAKHFFLMRDPRRVIASYIKGRAAFTVDDLGYAAQVRLYHALEDMTGTRPPIVDCDDILRRPETLLPKLCAALDMAFDPAMLAWPAGPRVTDGAWAPYWYASVERSTGFMPPPERLPSIPEEFAEIERACRADYDALYALRVKGAD